MAMTQEKFAALVEQLEIYARRNPLHYRIRVGLLAILGYVYIIAVVAGLLLAGWLLVLLVVYSHRINAGIIKLFIFLAIPIFVAGRSLWESFTMRFPPPTGIGLDRERVPQLFELVDELTNSLKCPPFHHILLTSDLNAGVSQIPKGFLLKGQENYLVVGLPLLQAVSPDRFRAILAHEFGHLSGNHNQFDGWIYRMRKTWMQILNKLHQSQHGAAMFIFERFLNWYAPFFNAYSFVLARADEYEADRCAARLAGEQAAAAALVSVNIKSFFLQESFWTRIYQNADEYPDPPKKLFTRMASELKRGTEPHQEQLWLQQALTTPTDLADTHPCLSDRLKALGYTPEQAPSLMLPIEQTAAEYYLGDAIAPLTEQLNQEWQTKITYQWRERYTQTQEMRQQLQALQQKALEYPLTLDDEWLLAKFTAQLKGNEEAIPLLRTVLEKRPDHVSANYWLGQILLEQGNEKGIQHLETAMAIDSEIILESCRYIYYFLSQQGREAEAKQYQIRAQDHYEKGNLAKQERALVKASDRFQPHEISLERLQTFTQQLANYSEVKEAYLVQKELQYLPEKPFYVLGVKRNKSLIELDGESKDLALVNRLAQELNCPGEMWIVILNNNHQKLEKAMKKVASDPIYRNTK